MRTSHILILSALVSATAAFAGTTGAKVAPPAAKVVEAKPIRDAAGAMSRAEGREAADAAIAGALVGIAIEQFNGEKIEIKLDTVDMRAVSPRDREVRGAGQLKVGGEQDWLPFRYRALYDTETQTAGGANITLGDHDNGGKVMATGHAVIVRLREDARQRLLQEFPQQSVALDLDRAQSIASGRYQRILASGSARFDNQPATKVQIEGLYDPRAKRWLRIAYELGDAANWAFHDGPAMVSTTLPR